MPRRWTAQSRPASRNLIKEGSACGRWRAVPIAPTFLTDWLLALVPLALVFYGLRQRGGC